MRAKSVSLWVIIFAAVWVGLLVLIKGIVPVVVMGGSVDLSVWEIIGTGVFFVVIFTPIYRSIWLDKKLGLEKTSANVEIPKEIPTEIEEVPQEAVQVSKQDMDTVINFFSNLSKVVEEKKSVDSKIEVSSSTETVSQG